MDLHFNLYSCSVFISAMRSRANNLELLLQGTNCSGMQQTFQMDPQKLQVNISPLIAFLSETQ